MAIKVKPVQNA